MDYIAEYSSDSAEEERNAPISAKTDTASCHADSEATITIKDAGKTDVHQGRTRSFPHVEGQYATHVFLEIALPDSERVRKIYDAFQLHLSTHVGPQSRMHPIENGTRASKNRETMCLHVSLSKTVPITSVQMESLLRELKAAFRKKKRALHLRIGGAAKVLVNEDGTRTFVALHVTDPGGMVEDMIESVSRVFIRHGLPKYYDNPDIHVSIAWCLGNSATGRLKEALSACSTLLHRLVWNTHITRVLCRIGAKDHCVWQAAA
mmetsp:Transcript_5555/g.10891  ORF Transcript_5555/g.10891 Transcript_5555/m.10891 type:complete len:263 (+) Transcript_5555:58-846(+)|eukprot:CAMPEP_0118802624 /NCGR_PEP_ID=MMETSP1161-20130426/9922_1 /TAXON_ID=249345 /ORGANISM="Picochlorum oklahomensis, Strain CCMP2329" /LENGTH=262 /DNA_ID=CAMNT_0006730913 /DNA_START=46 /DNA_END=834 /DNA_ORIENTATION=-